MTKVRRGCPGGDACTRKIPRKQFAKKNFHGRVAGERTFEKTINSVMRELYEEGLSDRDIGNRLGLSELSVNLWRRRTGLPSHTALRKECEQDWS